MVYTDALADLAKKLTEALPPGLKEMQQQFEQNFNTILQTSFAKLNLVTREEFDIQAGVLARTRAKLEALELKLSEIEAQMQDSKYSKQKTDKHKEK